MSAYATPITPSRFIATIKDLPLSNIHSLGAELRNSIAHLRSSNLQLAPFTEGEDADKDCVDAMRENEEVIVRLAERIEMLRREVEERGFRWADSEVRNGAEGGLVVNEHVGGEVDEEEVSPAQEANGTVRGGPTAGSNRPATRSRLGDEELRRRLEERMNEDDGGEDNGVLHL